MDFSIITPSLRNLQWLKLCVASVADQEDISLEHIIQDAGSDDGTAEWVLQDGRAKLFVEKDNGMYDAINRGFARASGDILAYLNCDEQYLPKTLNAVHQYFKKNPQTDVLFADTVVVDAAGCFVCCRKSMVPVKYLCWINSSVITSSIFLRRRVIDELHIQFDTRWRCIGDMFWIMDMVRNNLSMDTLRLFTSTFTETGANLDQSPTANHEKRLKWKMTPRWIRFMRFAFKQYHRGRKLVHGLYQQEPFDYKIYTQESPEERQKFCVKAPSVIWWNRHP